MLHTSKQNVMRVFYTIIIILTALNSCQSQENKIDNTKPLYGEIEKSKYYKMIDEDFRQDCLKQFGSIDSSVNVQIDHAWRYFYNNELTTAMKRFNQAWLLNPEFPDSYFGFASLLEMQGKAKEAERFYRIGIEKDLKNERAEICYQCIADCKEKLNDIEGVIEAYEKITIINPENCLAFKKIGYLKAESKKINEAMDAYNRAIELDPKDSMTFNNRGYLHQTLGNYQLAIEDYSKALELNQDYISALVNRGITELQINQFDKAKVDFEKCIKLDPKTGELRRFLGLAELKLNNMSKACENFEKALQLGDQDVYQLIKENCEK